MTRRGLSCGQERGLHHKVIPKLKVASSLAIWPPPLPGRTRLGIWYMITEAIYGQK